MLLIIKLLVMRTISCDTNCETSGMMRVRMYKSRRNYQLEQ